MSSRRSIGNTFHVTTVTDGTNGTNAFSVDLSNEMDSVACDNDMKTAAAFNIYSQIAAFYGVEDVTALCQIRYTSKPTNASLTLETSGSGTGSTSLTTTFQTISTKQWIRIHYDSGVSVSKRETLEVEIKHATYGTIALSIAVVGMKGGAIYNLVPSANAITHKKDGTYTPNVITCGSSKLDVATGTTSSNPSEATIKYSADGGSVTNYPSGGLTAGTNFTNYVTFFLYVNNTVVDKETVNIVTDGTNGTNGKDGNDGKDGKDGNDGAEGKGYKIFLKRDNKYTDVQWDTWGAIGYNDSYSKVTGDPDFTLCRVGDLFVVSGKSSDSGKNHTTTLKCSGVNVGVTPNVIYGTVVAHEHDGDDGQRGKAGRFYYFAGDWNSSTTYVMTDTQAPYVKASNGSFYMLDNAGNGGSNVNSTNQNPTNSSYGNGKPWSVMQSDHQYYIAKAFFGNYAQFGSAIINGDWMISTYGKKNGSTSNDYTSFDPSDPTGVSSSSHFAPNFCVDLKYGVCYMQDAYVKGSIFTPNFRLTAGNISSYATQRYDSAGFYYWDINLEETGLNLQIAPTSGSVIYINLPADAAHLGAEANIVCENYYVVIRNVYRCTQNINSMSFSKHHPMVYAGQKLKLRCLYINSSYRWVIEESVDHYCSRQPMIIGMGETYVPYYLNNSWHVGFDYQWAKAGSSFSISRDADGVYTVTLSSADGASFSAYCMICVYGIGYVYDTDDSPCKATLISKSTTSFKVATSDDDSRNEGAFGFVIFDYGRVNNYIV